MRLPLVVATLLLAGCVVPGPMAGTCGPQTPGRVEATLLEPARVGEPVRVDVFLVNGGNCVMPLRGLVLTVAYENATTQRAGHYDMVEGARIEPAGKHRLDTVEAQAPQAPGRHVLTFRVDAPAWNGTLEFDAT